MGNNGVDSRSGCRDGEKGRRQTGGGQEAGRTGREWVQICVHGYVPPPWVLLLCEAQHAPGPGAVLSFMLCRQFETPAMAPGLVLFLAFEVFQ